MDLITYAVSNRLQENGELLTYMDKDSIPKHVVEKSFERLMNEYSDEDAKLLVEDYKAYLSENVGVAITPKEDGLHVRGEINDDVVEVIGLVHGKSPETLVEGLITDTISVLNPEQEIRIKNIKLRDKVVRLREVVENTSAIVEHIEGIGRVTFEEPIKEEIKVEGPVEVKVDEPIEIKVDEPVEVKVEEPIEIPAELPEEIKIDEPISIDEPVEIKVEEPVEKPSENTEEIQIDLGDAKEPVVEAKVDEDETQKALQAVWENFLHDLDNGNLIDTLNLDRDAIVAGI